MTEIKPKDDSSNKNQSSENNKSDSLINDNRSPKPRVDLNEILAEIRNG